MTVVYNKKNYSIFLFFIVIAIIIRFFSFFPSVHDHDESTYIIIGRDILHGKELYKDVTDTKPVGIFLFYAGLEFLFGSSIFWKRFVFAIVVGITAYIISLVSKKFFKSNKVGFASGIIYIFYTSIWNYHGRSPNTELLFNLFTILGLLFFQKKNYKHFFWGGFLFGIGFIVKYLVLFDIFAILLFYFITELITKRNKSIQEILSRYTLATIGFILPFFCVNLFFWLGDNFKNFYFITYELPINYKSNPSITRYITMIGDFTAKFLPISIIIFYVIFKKDKPIEKRLKYFFVTWISAVLIAMYLPGKEFSHYTIQLMLPLSILGGLFFHPSFKTDKFTSAIYSKKMGTFLFVLIILTTQYVNFRDDVLKPDYPREIASYIKKGKMPGDKIFVSNYEQIIYYLLKIESPTKFIHSNLLFTDTHKAFNIDAQNELKKIMNTNPEFIIVEGKNSTMENLMGSNYILEKQFDHKKINLFRRI